MMGCLWWELRGGRIWRIRGVVMGLKCCDCFSPQEAPITALQWGNPPFINPFWSGCRRLCHFALVLRPTPRLLSCNFEVRMSPSSSLSSSSSSSSSPSPSPSSFGSPRDEVVSVSLGSASSEASESSAVLEALKSWHDVDLMVTEDLLSVLWDRYRIPECYGFHAPRTGQWSYN